ncbi:hypothetical protein JYU34_022048 [Plutella xylostella]|uniref:Uncharacterized protein n=1 Tax=Plutella xylostella TaxID=51655 RepID=A0ABQ7PQ52_PLUXY|nr:hypothetical protein JYU34_022048 [Plutella xylostella]
MFQADPCRRPQQPESAPLARAHLPGAPAISPRHPRRTPPQRLAVPPARSEHASTSTAHLNDVPPAHPLAGASHASPLRAPQPGLPARLLSAHPSRGFPRASSPRTPAGASRASSLRTHPIRGFPRSSPAHPFRGFPRVISTSRTPLQGLPVRPRPCDLHAPSARLRAPRPRAAPAPPAAPPAACPARSTRTPRGSCSPPLHHTLVLDGPVSCTDSMWSPCTGAGPNGGGGPRRPRNRRRRARPHRAAHADSRERGRPGSSLTRLRFLRRRARLRRLLLRHFPRPFDKQLDIGKI